MSNGCKKFSTLSYIGVNIIKKSFTLEHISIWGGEMSNGCKKFSTLSFVGVNIIKKSFTLKHISISSNPLEFENLLYRENQTA